MLLRLKWLLLPHVNVSGSQGMLAVAFDKHAHVTRSERALRHIKLHASRAGLDGKPLCNIAVVISPLVDIVVTGQDLIAGVE